MTHRSSLFSRLRRDRSGNIMYLTAAMLFPALACIGAGVDLGQAYMAKTRLQQACDAGVLAGRRRMGDGGFGGQARQAAENTFEFNYPEDIYESSDVTFTPTLSGASDIRADATATVDTILMHIFGKEDFQLEVSCTARLEMSNSDIMFVLDTTYSMTEVNAGDSGNRMTNMRNEVLAFYDQIESAETGGARIRYGFMPYSNNVNVGHLLRAADPNWISNSVTVPSRTGAWAQTSSTSPTTVNGAWSSYSAWSNTGVIVTPATSSNCSTRPRPTPNPQTSNGTPTPGSSVSGTNPRTRTTTSTVVQTESSFQNVWSSSACRQQRRTRTRTATTTSSVTEEYRYIYQDRTFDTTAARSGGALTADTADLGQNVTQAWPGCIIERDTTAFAPGAAIPATAYDLDINLVPNNDATRWRPLYPRHVFPRNTSPWLSQSSANVGPTTSDFLDYQYYDGVENASPSQAFGACPSQARRLEQLSGSTGRATINTYLNGLNPIGGTYHDVGMIWGARFASPTGIFAGDNATASNNAPISRHIIFMTDGQMSPHPGSLSFQGSEYIMNRVGSTNTTELTARHNARFQHACNAAKQQNMTVWVIAFGTTLNSDMTTCASGGSAFQANNSAQLRQRFQQIARQITRLRLQQ